MSQLPASPIRTLVLGDSPQDAEVIASLLQAEPGFTVSVSRVAYGEAARAIRHGEPDVILLLADSLTAADPLVAVEELEAAAPGAAIVALSAESRYTTRDFILAGARDCLSPPYDRELLAAGLRQVHAHERRRQDRLAAALGAGMRQHRCRVIAVHGVKGGVGATTVAVNLAVALRRLTGERIAIVDASLQTGDVGVALNLVGSAAIDDLVNRLNELDVDILNRVLVTHSSGVRVLLAPRDIERVDTIGGDEIRRILAFLAAQFDYVVVDTASTLDAVGLAALDYADQIVLLTTPEIPSLKNAGRFLQVSRRLGYPNDKLLLTVNRAGISHAVPLAEIERSLSWRPAATIPSADGLFVQAANRGEAVVATSTWRGPSRSLYRLARQVAVSMPSPRRLSLLSPVRALASRLTGRKKQPARGSGRIEPVAKAN